MIKRVQGHDRRVRTTGWTSDSGHSGNAPRDLREVKFPDGHWMRGLAGTYTRSEYYRFEKI